MCSATAVVGPQFTGRSAIPRTSTRLPATAARLELSSQVRRSNQAVPMKPASAGFLFGGALDLLESTHRAKTKDTHQDCGHLGVVELWQLNVVAEIRCHHDQ